MGKVDCVSEQVMNLLNRNMRKIDGNVGHNINFGNNIWYYVSGRRRFEFCCELAIIDILNEDHKRVHVKKLWRKYPEKYYGWKMVHQVESAF